MGLEEGLGLAMCYTIACCKIGMYDVICVWTCLQLLLSCKLLLAHPFFHHSCISHLWPSQRGLDNVAYVYYSLMGTEEGLCYTIT